MGRRRRKRSASSATAAHVTAEAGRPRTVDVRDRPRRARASYLDPAVLIPAGLVPIVFGLFQAVPSCVARLDDAHFRKEGVVVQGTVTEKSLARRSRMSWDRTVWYRFVTGDNRTVIGSDRMDHAEWTALQPGGAVAVAYLRSRPETNRIVRARRDELHLGLAVIGIGLVPLVVVGWRFRSSRRARDRFS